jgi:hypothetical protein
MTNATITYTEVLTLPGRLPSRDLRNTATGVSASLQSESQLADRRACCRRAMLSTGWHR